MQSRLVTELLVYRSKSDTLKRAVANALCGKPKCLEETRRVSAIYRRDANFEIPFETDDMEAVGDVEARLRRVEAQLQQSAPIQDAAAEAADLELPDDSQQSCSSPLAQWNHMSANSR